MPCLKYGTWKDSLWCWKCAIWLMMVVRAASLFLIFLTELCEWEGRGRLRKRRQDVILASVLLSDVFLWFYTSLSYIISGGISEEWWGGESEARHAGDTLSSWHHGSQRLCSGLYVRAKWTLLPRAQQDVAAEDSWRRGMDFWHWRSAHAAGTHMLMNEPDAPSMPWPSFYRGEQVGLKAFSPSIQH